MTYYGNADAVALAWLAGDRDGISRDELVRRLLDDIGDLHEDGYEVTISTDAYDPDRPGMLADIDAAIEVLRLLVERIAARIEIRRSWTPAPIDSQF